MANEVKLKLAIEGGQVVSTTIDGVTTRIGALDDKARAAASGSDALGNALKGLITVGAAMALIKMADSVTTLQTQLRLSSNSAAEAGKAYGALFDMAQKGRVSFTELGTTYAAVARSGRELGISQDRLLNVTKSISQAMTIGGGSATSMQAALVQLGQGLSSGVLRGEELNSIMEQTPRLAKAIADGLGVPIGKLRELGAAGELTSQQVISALEKAGPALAKEMETATLTVGQAFTMLGNSAVRFVGDADKATGASTTLATAMKSASEAMDTVGAAIRNNETAFAIVTYGLAGPAAAAGVYALSVAIGTRLIPALMGAAAAAGPLGWITIALSAMGGAAVAAGDAFTKSNQGMGISAAQLANQIAAIDKNAAAGLNDRGYKASEEDKRASAARRDELTDKKKLIDQAMNMRTADEGTATAAQNSRRAHSKLMKDAIADRVDFAKAGDAYLTKDQKNQATLNAEIDKTRALFEKGSISAAEYTQRINAVQASFAKAAPSVKGMSDAQKAAAKAQTEAHRVLLANASEHTKTVDAAIAADEKAHQLVNDQIRSARTMAEQIEFETQLLGMNAEQHALATMERELERQGIVKGTQAYDAYIEKLREAMALKVGKEAGIKAADDLREANKKAAEESGKYWEDALMRAFESGKGFFQSLWDTIKNTLKTQVLKVSVQGVMGSMGVGASGAAAAGGGGGSNLLGMASNLSSIYNGVSSMVTLGGQVVAGTMSVANALGTVAANATGTGISGLLAANGAYGTAAATSASGIAGGLTSTLAAIPGWGWAALAAGAVASIFGGRGDVESRGKGIEGNFSGNSFSGNSYAKYEQDGGWFHSDRNWTDRASLDGKTTDALSAGFGSLKASATSSAKALGLSTAAIDNYSKAINIQLTDDAAKNNEIITKMMSDVGDSMATALAPSLASFSKSGETASITLARLSGSLTTANAWLSMLRNRLFDISLSGADAASKLADAFGGLDNLAASSKAYYDAFYTDAERTARSTEDLAKAMALIGVAIPTTKAAFRDVVSGLDLTTIAGRDAYAVMLTLAPEFSAAADSAKSSADASIAAAEKVAKANQTLQDKLDVLTGARSQTQVDRENALKEVTDTTTLALMSQVYAQEDLVIAANNAQKAAIDLSNKLISTYIGVSDSLTPAMKSISSVATVAAADTATSASGMTQSLSYINEEMGNASSAVLTLTNSVIKIDETITPARAATELLIAQIYDLGQRADVTTINFSGLSAALNGVDTATFTATIYGVFEALAARAQTVFDSITTQRVAVREAALSIIGPQIYTKNQISEGISKAQVGMPTNAGVQGAYANQTSVGNAASRANDAATLVSANAQKALDDARSVRSARIGEMQTYTDATQGALYQGVASTSSALGSAQSGMAAQVAKYKELAAQFASVGNQYASNYSSQGGQAYAFNSNTNRISDWATSSAHSNHENFMRAVRGDAYYTSGTSASSLVGQLGGEGGSESANTVLARAEGAVDSATVAYQQASAAYSAKVAANNSSMATLNATQDALVAQKQSALDSAKASQAAIAAQGEAQKSAADVQSKEALLAYTKAMSQYTLDAGKATTQLGRLKDETVKYYTEQKRLADLMRSSAENLRATVTSYRYSQLSDADQLSSLKSQFGTAYSMALSTNGESLAGYADKLNSQIGPLIEKLTSSGETQYIASYLAQLETIAAKLEESAPVNYQSDSLALLDTIDGTLKALEDGTASATSILKEAINAGTDVSAAGLRQVVVRLGGVPAFAGGGSHSGGIRLVGENGPELEVTGPSRIFNAGQLRGMGGGGTERLEMLVERLTAEVKDLRAEARATAISTSKTVKILERVTPDGVSLQTAVAI